MFFIGIMFIKIDTFAAILCTIIWLVLFLIGRRSYKRSGIRQSQKLFAVQVACILLLLVVFFCSDSSMLSSRLFLRYSYLKILPYVLLCGLASTTIPVFKQTHLRGILINGYLLTCSWLLADLPAGFLSLFLEKWIRSPEAAGIITLGMALIALFALASRTNSGEIISQDEIQTNKKVRYVKADGSNHTLNINENGIIDDGSSYGISTYEWNDEYLKGSDGKLYKKKIITCPIFSTFQGIPAFAEFFGDLGSFPRSLETRG